MTARDVAPGTPLAIRSGKGTGVDPHRWLPALAVRTSPTRLWFRWPTEPEGVERGPVTLDYEGTTWFRVGQAPAPPAIPSPAIERLRRRYIPGDKDVLSEDEIRQRGVELVQITKIGWTLLAELVDWLFRKAKAEDAESRTRIVLQYAREWGTSEAKVWKAWITTCKLAGVPIPEDMPSTLVYEIKSACNTEKDLEEALAAVESLGLTLPQVRELKWMREQGLIDGWTPIRLVVNRAGTIYADDGSKAQDLVGSIHPKTALGKAGAALLERRARIRKEG